MVITQKITSLAFEIHDGKTSIRVSKAVCSKARGRRDRSEDSSILNYKRITWPRFRASSQFRQWTSEPGSEHKHSYVMGQ